jgi:large subunit ribosomal protein L28
VALQCDICGKGVSRGSKVSHAHNVSRRVWQPNLQRVRALVRGRPAHLKVCTRCLRSNRVQKAPAGRTGRPPRTATAGA